MLNENAFCNEDYKETFKLKNYYLKGHTKMNEGYKETDTFQKYYLNRSKGDEEFKKN